MSPVVLRAIAGRIAEHARTHGLPSVRVILHGGEPLLAGRAFLRQAVAVLRESAQSTRVDVSLQSNGVLLDEGYLDDFKELKVRVGVSVDGDASAHDRHRIRPNGRGSHAAVSAGLALLGSARYRQIFAGLLCTVNANNDPVTTYEALLRYRPPALDFLLPHANWSSPPPHPGRPGATPYGDWLVAVFDRWYGSEVQETRVRIFEQIIDMLLGAPSATEVLGLTPTSVLVIETDGAIEQVDALKSAYAGAPSTGLSVLHDAVDSALRTPMLVARQSGIGGLAKKCRSCAVRDVCGGGFYAHRYRDGGGFRNPSVYCDDLFRLIVHVKTRVHADLMAASRACG